MIDRYESMYTETISTLDTLESTLIERTTSTLHKIASPI